MPHTTLKINTTPKIINPRPAIREKFFMCFAVSLFLIFFARKTLSPSVVIMVTNMEPMNNRVLATEISLPITLVEMTPIQNIKVNGLTLLTKNPFSQNSK